MISPGERSDCSVCGEPVKFQAVKKLRRVIANVYVRGVWQRVEIIHPACYEAAGMPYGETEN